MRETPIPIKQTVWYKNPALWVNVVAVLVLILTTYCGITVPVELQTGIIAIINIVLQKSTMAVTKKRAAIHNALIRSKMH